MSDEPDPVALVVALRGELARLRCLADETADTRGVVVKDPFSGAVVLVLTTGSSSAELPVISKVLRYEEATALLSRLKALPAGIPRESIYATVRGRTRSM